jgi:uncharacterized protein
LRRVTRWGIVPVEMLEIRPNCQCCGRDLPADSDEALICSFECTWCAACAAGFAGGECPNCGGRLQPRPVRPAHLLRDHPPSSERIITPGCA